jgi:hypothetical protein
MDPTNDDPEFNVTAARVDQATNSLNSPLATLIVEPSASDRVFPAGTVTPVLVTT